MNLQFPDLQLAVYKSPLQIARVMTQAWANGNLYCAACQSDTLAPTAANYKATDFICDACGEAYELKSGKRPPGTRIVDAAYASMIAAIRGDRAPNLLYLHYSLALGVHNLLLIPRFFFTEYCIEMRKPLGPDARRAGWVGCNIRVDMIAPEGRIHLVSHRAVTPPSVVRTSYQRLAPLRAIPPGLRGWTLAVLLQLHRLRKVNFSLEEVYSGEKLLAMQFPGNRNVRPKIRQQLQILRDIGVLEFLGNGAYRLL